MTRKHIAVPADIHEIIVAKRTELILRGEIGVDGTFGDTLAYLAVFHTERSHRDGSHTASVHGNQQGA